MLIKDKYDLLMFLELAMTGLMGDEVSYQKVEAYSRIAMICVEVVGQRGNVKQRTKIVELANKVREFVIHFEDDVEYEFTQEACDAINDFYKYYCQLEYRIDKPISPDSVQAAVRVVDAVFKEITPEEERT